MEEILNFISQNYFYIPASIISALAVIIPSIVKIAKIVTDNTATVAKIVSIGSELSNLTKKVNELQNEKIESLNEEKAYIESLNSVTINKREKEINTARLEIINKKIESCKAELEAKPTDEAQSIKPTKRVRVKVRKGNK